MVKGFEVDLSRARLRRLAYQTEEWIEQDLPDLLDPEGKIVHKVFINGSLLTMVPLKGLCVHIAARPGREGARMVVSLQGSSLPLVQGPLSLDTWGEAVQALRTLTGAGDGHG